jgi:hypothetical protein
MYFELVSSWIRDVSTLAKSHRFPAYVYIVTCTCTSNKFFSMLENILRASKLLFFFLLLNLV